MKTRLLLLTAFILCSIGMFAQNTKHSLSSGKIIFDITYPESQLDEQTLAQLPSESTMYFKNDKSKVEVSMPMGKSSVISDEKTGQSIMLMDMMGNKIMMKLNKDDIKAESDKLGKPKVEKTRESKTIAGYTCYKAVVTTKTDKGDKSFDVWFTNDINVKNSVSSRIEGIEGFMMEFYSEQNGMGVKMSARSIEAMDVEDATFVIPEGYKEMSMEDLKKNGMK